MANGYYYLISALPELNLSDKELEYDMLSYRHFVIELLDPKDAKLLRILYYPYDILNLINLIKKSADAWDERGNYSQADLEEMIQLPDLLPGFMQHFVEQTKDRWNKTSGKDLLNKATELFIDWSREAPNAFLRQWLYFDQNLKNLLIYLNSKKFELDPKDEVLGENYEASYLRQTNFNDLDLRSWDLEFKEALTHFDNQNVAVREFLIDEMRWAYLEELEQGYSFGIERLLAFVIKLQIVHRNMADTEEAGRKRLAQLQDTIKKEYQMPETFN